MVIFCENITVALSVAALFLPALAFIFAVGSWAGFAVAALAPKQAFMALKEQGYGTEGKVENEKNPNPFEDFVFEGEAPVAKPVPPVGYNPLYPVSEQFFQSEESNIVLKKKDCYVKNMTKLSNDTVKGLMLSPLGFKVEKNSAQPQILIMHTHATESYQPENSPSYDPEYSCRNTDTSQNVVAVGAVMSETLNTLGYNTLHDTTLHDYPSYNKSYDNSKRTVEEYLNKYPSIKIVLDVHRDAIERNGERIAPTVSINGTKYAQIMII
ncbi:MAG: stage II sporulation protein P, partial [Oscillospiraceae bacterium]